MACKTTDHDVDARPPAVAILLAAGGGSRFHGDSHKLLAQLPSNEGREPSTVFERSLAALRAAAIGPIIIVTGALDVPNLESLTTVGPGEDLISICHNERWSEGQTTSVRVGIAAAAELGCNSVVIGLADQPFISPQAWQLVAAGTGPITVATYGGRRANPVRLDADTWDLLPTEGDEGARTLMRVRPELVSEVACPGSPTDIDTEEDLRRWQNN